MVEIIHAATLVHDDVIDDARTRRGRPSANAQWGNHTSVLAGDWLYMEAFQVALRERNFHVLDLLIGLTQMMVEGELLQLERIGRIDSHRSRLHGTGGPQNRLPVFGVRQAGRAGRPARIRRPRSAWASTPGTWAWRSNWWTTCSTSPRAKPCWASRWATICAKAKSTLPLVYALEQATAEERRRVETILRDRNYDRVPFPQILAMIESYQGIARVKERAQAFTEKARGIIGEFPDSPYQRALYSVTELVTERDH